MMTQRFFLRATGSVLLIILLAAIIIPRGNDVLLINGFHNDFTDRFFTIITHAGDGKVFVPIIILMLFVRFSYSLVALSAWAAHGLLCSVLKRAVFPEALRPAGVLDKDLLYFVPGVDVHTNYSFPSGHTATAFCFAIVISLVTRNKIVFFISIAIALVVAYSRVYLLQHFLMDVAAGAVVGTITALACWDVFETYGKAEWLGHRLEIQLKRGSRNFAR
ncbi:MAG TPA: phosphatase PAP2 family protein [Cyclobacteriaceae bacterium]|nr:phosphatase PAP2 family protein [Cyclobacteriaceae bacterium]